MHNNRAITHQHLHRHAMLAMTPFFSSLELSPKQEDVALNRAGALKASRMHASTAKRLITMSTQDDDDDDGTEDDDDDEGKDDDCTEDDDDDDVLGQMRFSQLKNML